MNWDSVEKQLEENLEKSQSSFEQNENSLLDFSYPDPRKKGQNESFFSHKSSMPNLGKNSITSNNQLDENSIINNIQWIEEQPQEVNNQTQKQEEENLEKSQSSFEQNEDSLGWFSYPDPRKKGQIEFFFDRQESIFGPEENSEENQEESFIGKKINRPDNFENLEDIAKDNNNIEK